MTQTQTKPAPKNKVTVDMTTGIGTLSFPHLFTQTATKNDKGETVYDLQFIIPKTQREDVRALLIAIQKVGKSRWGDNWKKVRQPLRDGDKEKDDLTEDGSTKGEKYPERLGCYFLNARSNRPVGVVDRQRNPILDSEQVYGGCKVKVALSFYTYSQQGNNGIGVGLNGVQKIADGESFGSSRPSVESMFDLLDEDDLDLDEIEDGLEDGLEDSLDEEPEEKPVVKKKAAKPAAKKKAKAPEPKYAEVDDEDDEDDLYADLDDLDDSDV